MLSDHSFKHFFSFYSSNYLSNFTPCISFLVHMLIFLIKILATIDDDGLNDTGKEADLQLGEKSYPSSETPVEDPCITD